MSAHFFGSKFIYVTMDFLFLRFLKKVLMNSSRFWAGSKIFENSACDTGPNEH